MESERGKRKMCGVGVAVVTGASRGIGRAIATMLAEHGYTVVSSCTRLGKVPEHGEAESFVRCDVACEEDRDALFASVRKRFGRLDLLVNNAGVAPLARTDILETGLESFERVLRINLYGTFFMCQAAAKEMLSYKQELGGGYTPRIVNISSISAYTASVNRPEYCISKAGVSMVTKLFAARLAQEGIPVFEVSPGIILTDMTAPVRDIYEEKIERGLTAIERFGRPEDVARMVLAAAGGLLDFSAGQVLHADGGFHLRRL